MKERTTTEVLSRGSPGVQIIFLDTFKKIIYCLLKTFGQKKKKPVMKEKKWTEKREVFGPKEDSALLK